MKYGKLGQGIMVKGDDDRSQFLTSILLVPCALVKRRKAHFFNLTVGASIILGCNGYVWITSVKTVAQEETQGGGYLQSTEVGLL